MKSKFSNNFLVTRLRALPGLQAYADYVFKDVGGNGDIKITGWYHDFDANVGNEDLGEEIALLAALEHWKRTAQDSSWLFSWRRPRSQLRTPSH